MSSIPCRFEVASDLARLPVGHVLEAADELPQALLPVEPEAHPVELAAPEPRQVEGGLAEGLRRERARVDRGASDRAARARSRATLLPK